MAVMTASQPANLEASEEATPSADALARLRAGDRAATDAMIRRHAPALRRLVGQLSGWPAETDDLVQDVFAAALMALPKFRGEASIGTWLTRIAIHRVRRWQRRQRLARLWGKAVAAQGAPHDRHDDGDEIVAERRQLVRQAIAELPVKYREVIVLRYLEERSTAEVAAILDVRTNTVDVRAHRGRQLLAARLGQHKEFAILQTK